MNIGGVSLVRKRLNSLRNIVLTQATRLLNAAHFVIVSYTQYFYAVTNFGNPEIILRVDGCAF